MRSLKISFPVAKLYKGNIPFNPSQNTVVIRDNAFDRYYKLAATLGDRGHVIATDDIISVDDSDIVLFSSHKFAADGFDYPGKLTYLLLSEPPVVDPGSYDPAKHHGLHRIFTWHDALADGEKYIKLNVPQKFPERIHLESRSRFCTMIVGNKSSGLPNELYSKRVELIRWFEDRHPEEFDLYGVGWNEFVFKGPIFMRAFNRVPLARKLASRLFGEVFPSYRGRVESKNEILKEYKFTICYENSGNIPGYITEKIFDAFFAGSVPIYLGASNVTEYIPEDCFIDQRNFSDYESLYAYMASLQESDLGAYRARIEAYLHSDKARQFRSDYVAQVMADQILADATRSGLFDE